MYEVEQIKQQLDFTDILQKYGFEVNRAGFISCPFPYHKRQDTQFKN